MATDGPLSTISRSDAQRLAQRELAKPQYHATQNAPVPQSPPPTSATPSPPPSSHHFSLHVNSAVWIVLAALLLVLVVFLLVRRFGKPRRAEKSKKAKGSADATAAALIALVGAAKHRHDADVAAAAGLWAEAIRERFRAVIATLDERGLLPDRPYRTADEAAADAGALLPAHAAALSAAARAFDEVEYGRYTGTAEAYAVIVEVDRFVSAMDAAPQAGSAR